MSKQMTAEEMLAASQEYYRLMRSGVPAGEAFKRAYPNGIPSKQDQIKNAAKAQQQAGLAGTGGTVAGAIAGKAAIDAATGTGWFAKKAAEEGAKNMVGFGADAGQSLPTFDLATEGASPLLAPETAAAGTEATMGAAPAYTYALPALAVALGGRYVVRQLQGKTKAWQDASVADNAGRAILGMATGGLSEVANKFGGDKNMWQTERNRLNALAEQGYTGLPDYSNLSGGRSKQQLIDEAKATGGNVEFAQTRNEGSLTPQDIVGYASIIEKAGQGASLDQRMALAQQALQAGAVREHHGTVDVDWSKIPQAGAAPQGMQSIPTGLAAALVPAQSQQIDPGTLRRWRLGRNG